MLTEASSVQQNGTTLKKKHFKYVSFRVEKFKIETS